jgi:hypothetical protein
MPEEFIKTSADKITKKMFLAEENADVRREVARKIGIEKTVKMLGAKAKDKLKSKVGGKYELLMIDLDGRGNERPYLKMENPSIDAHHIEGVDRNVTTVEAALCFRNRMKKFVEPQFLS